MEIAELFCHDLQKSYFKLVPDSYVSLLPEGGSSPFVPIKAEKLKILEHSSLLNISDKCLEKIMLYNNTITQS